MITNLTDITKLISREAASAALGVRPQTLAYWACVGRYHLPFVRVGRRVMYRASAIEAFITANLVTREAA